MTKRDLFAELSEGFDALASARAGKRTLRTHEVELKPEVTITSAELKSIREHLNLSRSEPPRVSWRPVGLSQAATMED